MQQQRVSALSTRSFPFRSGLCVCDWAARAVTAFVRLSPARALSILAISCLQAAFSASAQQQVQFSQGFSGSGQSGSSTPAESNAYAAAMSQPNPAVRIAAIQQFLNEYPNSGLRQQAVSQLILARRQGHGTVPGPGAMPAAPPAHPAPSPSVVPAAAPVSQMYAAPRESLCSSRPNRHRSRLPRTTLPSKQTTRLCRRSCARSPDRPA